MDYFNDITWGEAGMDILDITIRAVVSIVVLFLLSKILGNKQLSQLSFFDYAVGISIGSIAADMAVNPQTPHHFSIIAMLVYILISSLVSILSLKSIKMRRFLNGTPITLIENGKILEENLYKAKISINDLLSECRHSGYFDITSIQFAVEETSGNISFMPKNNSKPLTAKDMGVTLPKENEYANVIIDGKIIEQNLNTIGKSVSWLNYQLDKKKHNVEDVLLAILDNKGNLKIYSKNVASANYNIFD